MNSNIHIRKLLIVCFACGFLWVTNALLLHKDVQAHADPIVLNPLSPTQASTLHLQAERRQEGIWLNWQTTADSGWMGFTVYASLACQWENAVVLTAPIFSSTNHVAEGETEVIHYSLLDDSATAMDVCSYWIVGTAADGASHTFGPTEIEQQPFGLYLPIVHR